MCKQLKLIYSEKPNKVNNQGFLSCDLEHTEPGKSDNINYDHIKRVLLYHVNAVPPPLSCNVESLSMATMRLLESIVRNLSS